MEKHLGFLERRCRLCGKTFSKVQTVQNCDKTAFGRELLNFFGVDIGLDSREIHPQKVWSACRRVVYHLNSGNLDPETSEGRKQGIKLFLLKEHSSNCYCLQKLKGRPSKKELCNNANRCNFSITELKCQCWQYNKSIGHPWISLSFQWNKCTQIEVHKKMPVFSIAHIIF